MALLRRCAKLMRPMRMRVMSSKQSMENVKAGGVAMQQANLPVAQVTRDIKAVGGVQQLIQLYWCRPEPCRLYRCLPDRCGLHRCEYPRRNLRERHVDRYQGPRTVRDRRGHQIEFREDQPYPAASRRITASA